MPARTRDAFLEFLGGGLLLDGGEGRTKDRGVCLWSGCCRNLSSCTTCNESGQIQYGVSIGCSGRQHKEGGCVLVVRVLRKIVELHYILH